MADCKDELMDMNSRYPVDMELRRSSFGVISERELQYLVLDSSVGVLFGSQ